MEQPDSWLQQRIASYYQTNKVWLRPFLPNRDWRRARVFIIGKNAATPFPGSAFGSDPEQYWNALTDEPNWFWHEYCRQGASPTNRREWALVQRLHPLNVLVTNVHAYPSAFGDPLPYAERHAADLRYLLAVCKPELLVLHGKEAITFAKEYLSPQGDLARSQVSLTSGVLPPGPGRAGADGDRRAPCLLLATYHLSGIGWPKGSKVNERMDQLVQVVRRTLGAPGNGPSRIAVHPCDP